MKAKIFTFSLLAICFCFASESFSQIDTSDLKTVTLLNRVKTAEKDNFADTAISFEKGVHGESGKAITKNDWDMYYVSFPENNSLGNYFNVTTGKDDLSRIKDLGKFEWTDKFEIPDLPAYEIHTREALAAVNVGHIYLVHTKDTDSDLYALFRVEELKTGEAVTISWKVIRDIQKN